jgi:hypothetical protein
MAFDFWQGRKSSIDKEDYRQTQLFSLCNDTLMKISLIFGSKRAIGRPEQVAYC